jgi:hypothetical protein
MPAGLGDRDLFGDLLAAGEHRTVSQNVRRSALTR